MKVILPEKYKFLYHLVIKILPFGLGMFCLGASLTSLISKRNLVHLSAFLAPELMTEAHQKWYCMTASSYTSDLIILCFAVVFLFTFAMEVKLE